MNITKLKYYSTEKLEGILDELENGDGGRGMKDLQLADMPTFCISETMWWTVFRKNQYPY